MNGAETTGVEQQAATRAPKSVTISMNFYKDHKHVVQYRAGDPDAEVSGVYVSKAFGKPMPRAIRVTVEPAA